MKLRLIAAMLLVFATLFGAACSDDPANNGGITPTQDTGNNGVADSGQDTDGEEDTGQPDMGTPPPDMPPPEDMGTDTNMENAGFLHGTWEVQRKADDTVVATLEIEHEPNSATAEGTYSMTEPIVDGMLGATYWMNQTFQTSWTFREDGSLKQISISNGTKVDENTIDATMLDQRVGGPAPVSLVRK